MNLSDLQNGDSAVIVRVSGHGAFRRRIIEMGFVRGQKVTSMLNSPLNDPVKYGVMGYEVSLRRSEAAMIEVLPEDEANQPLPDGPEEAPNANDPTNRRPPKRGMSPTKATASTSPTCRAPTPSRPIRPRSGTCVSISSTAGRT